jgi:hypothetical protein
MEMTFYEVKIGDTIYFADIENSVLVDKEKINSATVILANKTSIPYEVEITLSNSKKFKANWNLDTCVIYKCRDMELYYSSATLPTSCSIYSPDANCIKEEIARISEKKYRRLEAHQKKVNDEMINMSALQVLSRRMKVVENTEVVSETVVV